MAEATTEQPTGRSPAELARLAYRKLVYRKVEMGRFGALAKDHVALSPPCSLPIEILGPDRYREVLGTSPHLGAEDVDDFDRQASFCIVARDGERLAASTWMTWGDVHVHELHRTIEVPPGQHFSTRSYVDPDYRGLSLLSHMIQHYAERQAPNDEVWGFVYFWNAASVRSLDKIGWTWSGDYWTRFVLGRKVFGQRRFPARPAMDAVRPR